MSVELASAPGERGAATRPRFRPLPYKPYPVLDTDAGPVFIHPDDRKYGTLLVGGQGSGKTSALLRLALNDVLDPDAALIVFDPKSELSGLLLELIPSDCGKEVWHLDLGHPAFGMSPLRLPEGAEFAVEATGIAEGIVSSLLDISEGQIFQSSKRYLYHATIGELAMARLEERRPQIEGIYSLLLPKREDMREAAANACHQTPDLDQTAAFFLRELPDDLQLAGASVAQRMDAPRNKLSGLVGVPAVRRFFNHPTDVAIGEIITGRGILLVDANMARIGGDIAETLIAIIFRELHRHMQHQVQWPEAERPRVAVIADEAHYLVNELVIDQIATHRAAGLDVTLALQFIAQLGASARSAATTEKIRSGVLNLVQSRFLFRLGEPQDAEQATRIAMSVYETMIRADSRIHMRATPEEVLNLPVWHALNSWIAGGSRAPSFIGRTYPFSKITSHAWREHHLAHMASRVQPYPETLGHTYRRQVDPKAIKHLAVERAAREKQGNGAVPASTVPSPESAKSTQTDEHGSQLTLAEPAPAASDGPAGAARARPSPAESARSQPAPSRPPRGEKARDGKGTRNAQREAGKPGSAIRVDNYRLLPLPELAVSDVRTVWGNVPRPGSGLDPAADPAEGKAAPWLLRELAFIDRFHHFEILQTGEGPLPRKLLDCDYAILKLLDRVGLVLRDTLGRAVFGATAKLRTVQHHTKKLHDAGLIARANIAITNPDRRVPQIYALTAKGLRTAQAHVPPVIHPDRKFQEIEGRGATVPHDHHVVHWLLELEELLGPDVVSDYWRTPRYATGRITPPQVGGGRGRHQLTLTDISLPAAQMITGLQSTSPGEREGRPRGFRELRPDLAAELRIAHARRADGQPGLTFDALIELDRSKPSHNTDKFIDYDSFLVAWWATHRRYATLATRPVVVFVCQTWERALQNAALADKLMTGAIGHSGTPAQDWYYAGRDHIFFTAETDIYFESLRALALHPWPPNLRDALGQGEHSQPTVVSLLPPSMIEAHKRRLDAN
jgi:hypothetical protein